MRAKNARGSNSEVEPLEPLGRLAKCRQRARSAALSSFIRADEALAGICDSLGASRAAELARKDSNLK
jgi:hypothetical protein